MPNRRRSQWTDAAKRQGQQNHRPSDLPAGMYRVGARVDHIDSDDEDRQCAFEEYDEFDNKMKDRRSLQRKSVKPASRFLATEGAAAAGVSQTSRCAH